MFLVCFKFQCFGADVAQSSLQVPASSIPQWWPLLNATWRSRRLQVLRPRATPRPLPSPSTAPAQPTSISQTSATGRTSRWPPCRPRTHLPTPAITWKRTRPPRWRHQSHRRWNPPPPPPPMLAPLFPPPPRPLPPLAQLSPPPTAPPLRSQPRNPHHQHLYKAPRRRWDPIRVRPPPGPAAPPLRAKVTQPVPPSSTSTVRTVSLQFIFYRSSCSFFKYFFFCLVESVHEYGQSHKCVSLATKALLFFVSRTRQPSINTRTHPCSNVCLKLRRRRKSQSGLCFGKSSHGTRRLKIDLLSFSDRLALCRSALHDLCTRSLYIST